MLDSLLIRRWFSKLIKTWEFIVRMAEEGVCPFVSLYSFVRSEIVLDVVVRVLGRGRVVELELLGVEVLRREIHYIHEIG